MISVKDLIEGRKNDSSSSLQLCGRLSMITNTTDHYQRGSILLSDILTGDVIHCQVDRMYHDLQGSLISISQWTFVILGNELLYLQFSLDNVKRFGSSTTLLDEKTLAVRTFLQLLKASAPSDFSCLHPRQLATTYPGDVPKGVTLAGLLVAKSILYIKQGSEACFFVELKDIYQLCSASTSSFTAKAYQWTVPVVFKGDQFIKYYMELQVGRHYLFNNLQATTMTTLTSRSQRQQQQQQQPRRTKRSVLNFQILASSFLDLPKQQCQFLLSKYNPTESDSTSFDVDMPHPAAAAAAARTADDTSEIPISVLDVGQNNLHQYTGVVTRVIDPLFGVYELDQQILLCLFHYIGYSENCPYRVGTKLVVTHAHVLSLESPSTVSSVLDVIWNAPRMTPPFDAYQESEEDGFTDDDDDNNNNNNNSSSGGGDARKTTQKSERFILVACMRSDVRIKEWLDIHDDFATTMDSSDQPSVDLQDRHISDSIYAHCVSRHLTFAAMVRQLELFESMKKKFANLLSTGGDGGGSDETVSPLIWLGQQLIEVVFSTTGNRSAHGQGDLYGDFFQHGQSCLAVNESTNATGTVTLDACPTLQHLISTILESDNNSAMEGGDAPLSYKLDHVPLIEMPPSFVTSHAGATRYCYDAKTKDTAWVVGLVEALPDGQVYFMDATYRIKLLVTTADNLQQVPSARWKNTGRLQLGHVYIIKRFHLVVETLTLSGVASTLEQQYMMCGYQDIKTLGPFASSIPSSTAALSNTTLSVPLPTKKEDLLRLTHFNITHGAGNIPLNIAIYVVLDMMPTTMKRGDNNVLGFEKWVRAIRYGLGPNAGNPAMVNLIFTSHTGSLSYTGHLQVGSWFGLTMMDETDQFTDPDFGNVSGRNNRNNQATSSSSPNAPIFLVDRSKHQLYPIIYQHQHSRFQHHQPQQQNLHSLDRGHAMMVLYPGFGNPLAVTQLVWDDLAPALHIVDAVKMKSPLKRQYDQMENGNNNNNNKKDKGLITLYGTVLFKGFIADEGPGCYVADEGQVKAQVELFQRLGVGFGQRGLKMFMRLQQAGGLETADIYMGGDLHHLSYFLGVVPGNKVTLFRVDKKKSGKSRKIYFVAGPRSYMEVYPQLGPTLFDDLLALGHTTCARPLALTDLLPSFDQNDDKDDESDTDVDNDIFKAVVSIRRIEKLKLQWVCTLCGTEWHQNKCYGNCGEDGRQVFRAEAKVQVTDGTTIVMAMIDGEALVFRLLMLLPSQEETLKQAALTHGTLECGFWMDGQDGFDNMASMTDAALRNGMTLRDLGMRVKLHGQFNIYGKRYYQRYATTRDDTLEEAQPRQKMDNLGLQDRMVDDQDMPVKTLTFPFVKVKVESLELVDPEQQAWNLMDELLSG